MMRFIFSVLVLTASGLVCAGSDSKASGSIPADSAPARPAPMFPSPHAPAPADFESTGFGLDDFALSDDASEELVTRLSELQSSQADFKQVTLDGRGSVLQQTHGEMWVKRPNHFKWSVNAPYRQVIWSDADSVWMYDIDLEQVVHDRVNRRAGNAPSLLLSGDPAKIASHFTVEKTLQRGDQAEFQLHPKDQESAFKSLSVVFLKQALLQIELIDHLGQRTAIRFDNFKSNPVINSALFTPDYPKSVDVIENDAS